MSKSVYDQPKPQPSIPSYTVTVNYCQTVEQLIKAGNYGWVNGSITDKHFRTNKKGEEQIEIFTVSTDRQMSNSEVSKLLDSLGLRDANIKELLSLGAQHPDLQRQNIIVARGSRWRDCEGDLMVPHLFSNMSRRHLDLINPTLPWFFSGWQFAAVRK